MNFNKYITLESRRKLGDKINTDLKQSEKESLNRIHLDHVTVEGHS
jgi:hypothetical protein